MTEQRMALVPAASGQVPSQGEYRTMLDMAQNLLESGFLPKAVNTPQKALAIIQKGRELGIPPMHALSNIAVIEGKPTAGAELMLALIYRDHGDNAIIVEETDANHCTVVYQRRSWRDAKSFTFSTEDAKQAGLLGKDNWRKYPAAMLRARCISAVARLAFPDSIGGMYTPEELGAEVEIDDAGETRIVNAVTGEILDAKPQPARENQSAVAEDAPAPGRGRTKLLESVMTLCEELAPLRGKGEDKAKVLRAACNANEITATKPADLTVDQLSTLLNGLTTQRDIYRNSQEPAGSDMAEEPAEQDLY